MKKVTILSYKRFMEFLPDVNKEDVVAIRIGDTAPIKDTASKRYAAMLPLSFYDIWEYEEDIDRNTPVGSNRLTAKDKDIIDRFIDENKDKSFVLHCEQGISRSAAVGYYVLKRLGYEEELTELQESGLYTPNPEVYGVLIGKPYTKATDSEIKDELKGR